MTVKGTKDVLQSRKQGWVTSLKDCIFFTWGAGRNEEKFKLIEKKKKTNVNVTKRNLHGEDRGSCVNPRYLRKPPDNLYCSSLKL